MFPFKTKRKQQPPKLQRCRHGETAPCEDCQRKGTPRCTVLPVLTDSSVLLSLVLDDENTSEAEDFVRQSRQKQRMMATNEILGEVFRKAIIEAGDRLDTAIEQYKDCIPDIEVVSMPLDDKEFAKLLLELTINKTIRCGSIDRRSVATAIHYKIPFFYFDSNLDKDINTINKIANPWGKLVPFR